MEVSGCQLVFAGMASGIISIVCFVITSECINFWNKPPDDSECDGKLSRSLRSFRKEAERLGISLNRLVAVGAILCLVSLLSYGFIQVKENVTIVDCQKTESTVASILPCNCESE